MEKVFLKLPVIGFIVLSIFLAGCGHKPSVVDNVNQQSSSVVSISQNDLLTGSSSSQINVSETRNDYDGILAKIKPEYKNDQQFNSCMVNNVKNCVNDVVNTMASEKNDAKICEEMSEQFAINSCKDSIYVTQALKNKDASLCQNVILNKANCLIQVAKSTVLEKSDIKYCDLVTQYAQTGTGANEQNFDAKFLKTNCINESAFQLASINKNAKFCESITEPNMKKACQDSIKLILTPGRR